MTVFQNQECASDSHQQFCIKLKCIKQSSTELRAEFKEKDTFLNTGIIPVFSTLVAIVISEQQGSLKLNKKNNE